jgi:hypothetical protein
MQAGRRMDKTVPNKIEESEKEACFIINPLKKNKN